MGDRAKRIWGVGKGLNDFRWILLWFAGLPWGVKVVALMTPLFLLWISILRSLPWPVLMFLGLSILVLLAVFTTAFMSTGKQPDIPTAAVDTLQETALDLILIPHGDNSSELCLEIKNNVEPVKLTAQIRVMSRSYGDVVDTRPYEGWWNPRSSYKQRFGDTRDIPHYLSVEIARGRSRTLRIATASSDNGSCSISEAKLAGSGEFLRWDFEPNPDSHLPFWIINVELFGEGITKTVSNNFQVGPKAFRGPLGMQEVSA
jgi:hypothetical protein